MRRPRPPWWPEDQTWPPSRDDWRGRRRRFVRRVIRQFAVGFAIIFAIVAVSSALGYHESGAGGGWRWRGPPIGGLVVVLIVGVIFVSRFVRRTAAPIDEVMEAAGQLAAGDYATRVDPKGSGEVRDLALAFNAMAERLEANERQRRALFADVAHELRTPLAIIRGNAEGMVDGVYSADAAHLAPIIEETEVMARLLQDLSTLSTAEAGMLSLQPEQTTAQALVDEVVAAFQPRASAAGSRLVDQVAAGLPALQVDPVRIREVLSNLVGNALRYTPAGGVVTIGAESTEGGAAVRFVVSDTGSGIPADELPGIFERFRKSSESRGTGLGLAIAKQLVEAHAGTIEAESVPGEGTTMRFSLRVSPE